MGGVATTTDSTVVVLAVHLDERHVGAFHAEAEVAEVF